MFSSLVKTQPDWHNPVNQNFNVAADKLTIQAVCTYNAAENVYVLQLQNIPAGIASGLPNTLPADLFTVIARFPNEYANEAKFRIGSVDFVAKYAGFEAGDVLSVLFDRAEEKCFFKLGGSTSAGLAAFAGSAYAGASYLG